MQRTLVGEYVELIPLMADLETPIKWVIKQMAASCHDAVIVLSQNKPVGLVTEDDVIHIDIKDLEAINRPIKNVMSSPVITLGDDADFSDIPQAFRANNITHIVVIDRYDKPVGIISEKDYVKKTGIEYYLTLKTVEGLPLVDVVYLEANATVAKAIEVMDGGSTSVIVGRPPSTVQGILTRKDLIRHIASNEGLYNDCLKETIGNLASFPVCHIDKTAPLLEAKNVMTEKNISHLVVKQAENVLGVLTFGEIMLNIENEYNARLTLDFFQGAEKLRRSRQEVKLAQQVIDAALDGITITDLNGTIISVNPAFTKLTGYAPEEVIGKNPNILSSGRHDKAFYNELWMSLLSLGSWQGEIWNKRKNGEIYPEWLTITAIRDESGEITKFAGIFSDITDRKKSEKKIKNYAYFDTLTSLPNRRLLSDRLKQAIANANRHKHRVALIFLDLDKFKNINDSYGHDVGDAVLKEMARRLVACTREGDTIARLGGDEFVIMIPEVENENELKKLATRIIGLFARPFQFNGYTLYFTTSIGVCVYPDQAESTDDLMRYADLAMYQAKAGGCNQFVFYNKTMATLPSDNNLLKEQILEAINNQGIDINYQPQINLDSNRCQAIVLRCRWENSSLERVDEADLYKLTERVGCSTELNKFLIQTTFRLIHEFNEKNLQSIRLAVKVLPAMFNSKGFIELIKTSMADENIKPENLELQIPESCLINRQVISQLNDLGVYLTVDNFGASATIVSSYKDIRINSIKINEQFMESVPGNDTSTQFVSAVIAMFRTLGVDILVEGVNTEQQLQYVQDQKCTAASGFWFGNHSTLDEMIAYLNLI